MFLTGVGGGEERVRKIYNNTKRKRDENNNPGDNKPGDKGSEKDGRNMREISPAYQPRLASALLFASE